MLTSRLQGAVCALLMAAPALAQSSAHGTMNFNVLAGLWVFQNCYYNQEIDDPIGVIAPDGSRVNTVARADGDTCYAHGFARDTVVGGVRWEQQADAEGYHTCTAWYVPTFDEPLGEVEIFQRASMDGEVRLTNLHGAAAALGFCTAQSSVGTFAQAMLFDSAAETVAGGLGDLSQAYCGLPIVPNISIGTGVFRDSDFADSGAVVCTNSLVVEHTSCAFAKVLAVRVPGAGGANTRARAEMDGLCETFALLYICP